MNILIGGIIVIVLVISAAVGWNSRHNNYKREVGSFSEPINPQQQIIMPVHSVVVEIPQKESEEMPDSFQGISSTMTSAGISATGPTQGITISPHMTEKVSIHDIEPGYYVFGEEVEEDKV